MSDTPPTIVTWAGRPGHRLKVTSDAGAEFEMPTDSLMAWFAAPVGLRFEHLDPTPADPRRTSYILQPMRVVCILVVDDATGTTFTPVYSDATEVTR